MLENSRETLERVFAASPVPMAVTRYSDGAIVPGNAYIDAAEIARRSGRFWAPYRQEIAATVDAMHRKGAR